MKIVLDTNVLVSGLLSAYGAPAEIVRMAASGVLELCYDSRILTEYREVLLRPRFAFAPGHVAALLRQIEAGGHLVAPSPLPHRLPDPDDEPFLEVAAASGARFLVTGNLRHYPAGKRQGVKVVAPAQFIEIYRQEN